MDPCGRKTSMDPVVEKQVWTPVVGEKLSKKTMPAIQGKLLFESVALLLAMYQELVQCPQLSMKTHDSRHDHDSRLTLATRTLATCSRTDIPL